MRSSFVMSLIGATSMALALLVGCGDDDAKPASSQAGQSCVRTADCADGLSCIANVCYKTPPVTGGEGGEPSTPVGPVLGGEGESCTSHLDCAAPLGCFNNRCTDTASSGDGGEPGTSAPGVTLGSRGESCAVNGDCSKGLVCVPTAAIAGTGVCDFSDYGIEPNGMTCSGECLADSDCYQLPIALHTATVKSCEDIADAISANAYDCAAPVPAAKTLCFEQATYCGYKTTSKTWTCDDNHACVYNTACVVAAGSDVPTGCPSVSRLRSLAALTCNPDTLKCVGPTAAAGCTTDAKCEGKQVFDSLIGDLCTAGECTCYAGNKQCYRKCARDIDCGAGQTCDTKKSKLCIPSAACDTDAQCAVANGNVAYKCKQDTNTCAEACDTDRDCSGSGINTPFNGRVCVDKFCQSVAADCSETTQCAPLLGGLKPFCVEVAPAAGTTVSSSVTD